MHLSASKNSKNYNNNRKETELIQSDYDKSQNNLFATKADLSSVYPSNSSDNLNFPSHKFNKSPVKRPNAKSPIKPKDLKIQSGHYSDLRNNQTLERTTIVRASYKKYLYKSILYNNNQEIHCELSYLREKCYRLERENYEFLKTKLKLNIIERYYNLLWKEQLYLKQSSNRRPAPDSDRIDHWKSIYLSSNEYVDSKHYLRDSAIREPSLIRSSSMDNKFKKGILSIRGLPITVVSQYMNDEYVYNFIEIEDYSEVRKVGRNNNSFFMLNTPSNDGFILEKEKAFSIDKQADTSLAGYMKKILVSKSKDKMKNSQRKKAVSKSKVRFENEVEELRVYVEQLYLYCQYLRKQCQGLQMDNKNIEEEKMKLKQYLEELRAGKHKSEKIIEEFRNELKKVHKDMEEMDKKRSGKIRKNSIISQDSKVRYLSTKLYSCQKEMSQIKYLYISECSSGAAIRLYNQLLTNQKQPLKNSLTRQESIINYLRQEISYQQRQIAIKNSQIGRLYAFISKLQSNKQGYLYFVGQSGKYESAYKTNMQFNASIDRLWSVKDMQYANINQIVHILQHLDSMYL